MTYHDKELRNAKRQAIDAYKRELGCADCGTKEGRLDFDHRDKTTKRFKVGCSMGASWQTLLVEIAKCDVRCAPCHAKKHHREEPGLRAPRPRTALVSESDSTGGEGRLSLSGDFEDEIEQRRRFA